MIHICTFSLRRIGSARTRVGRQHGPRRSRALGCARRHGAADRCAERSGEYRPNSRNRRHGTKALTKRAERADRHHHVHGAGSQGQEHRRRSGTRAAHAERQPRHRFTIRWLESGSLRLYSRYRTGRLRDQSRSWRRRLRRRHLLRAHHGCQRQLARRRSSRDSQGSAGHFVRPQYHRRCDQHRDTHARRSIHGEGRGDRRQLQPPRCPGDDGCALQRERAVDVHLLIAQPRRLPAAHPLSDVNFLRHRPAQHVR
jgi:hypothetical protein